MAYVANMRNSFLSLFSLASAVCDCQRRVIGSAFGLLQCCCCYVHAFSYRFLATVALVSFNGLLSVVKGSCPVTIQEFQDNENWLLQDCDSITYKLNNKITLKRTQSPLKEW